MERYYITQGWHKASLTSSKSLIRPFDVKSGVLWTKCESKVESGSIASDDVKTAIKLRRLAEQSQQVDRFTLLRDAHVDDDFVLVLRILDLMARRNDSDLSDRIEGEFGQKVWFVESEASDRRFMEGHPSSQGAVGQPFLDAGWKQAHKGHGVKRPQRGAS